MCRNQLPYGRLGLAVPKRHLRRSVDRNLVRRLIRESFRKRAPAGMDILVILIDVPDLKHRKRLAADLSKLWRSVENSASDNDNKSRQPAPLDAASN